MCEKIGRQFGRQVERAFEVEFGARQRRVGIGAATRQGGQGVHGGLASERGLSAFDVRDRDVGFRAAQFDGRIEPRLHALARQFEQAYALRLRALGQRLELARALRLDAGLRDGARQQQTSACRVERSGVGIDR